jgi:ornithine cyclodeaminase/alanine dehydrogenase-like protein (mu-crystallin family)
VRLARAWSRSEERRSTFAAECSRAFGIAVEAAPSAREAVSGAPIVITATNSREPVLESAWISTNSHVNAVGSNQAERRELPADLIHRADLIAVDSLEQARMESGDLLMALEEPEWSRVVELQEVVAGRHGVPRRPGQITVFKSNGLAVEDVVCAGFVYEQAVQRGLGRVVGPPHS